MSTDDVSQRPRPRLRVLQSEIVCASRASILGEMAATLARELNQPLAAIVNHPGGPERRLASAPLDRAKIQGALARADGAASRAGPIGKACALKR